MKLTKTQEEYLKTIYLLQKENNRARVTDIADRLDKAKATVNYTIIKLKELGLLNYETYGEINLTDEGEKAARKILEAYDIVYIFLKDVLDLDEESANKEAEKLKASMSDETLNINVTKVKKVNENIKKKIIIENQKNFEMKLEEIERKDEDKNTIEYIILLQMIPMLLILFFGLVKTRI